MGKASTSVWLLAAGVLLVLFGLGFQVYPLFGQWQHSLTVVPPADRELPASQSELLLKPTSTAIPAYDATATQASHQAATASATPTPTPVPVDYGEAIWITIPAIEVDSKVVESWIEDGAYTVPLYDVGHHVGSPSPGQPGNSVYVGHVETISAGHVFARIKDMVVGDKVSVFTPDYRTDWVVTDIRLHENTDSSFLAHTNDPTITLYTCHGTFDWATRDFSHRIVVTGRFLGAEKRAVPGADDGIPTSPTG